MEQTTTNLVSLADVEKMGQIAAKSGFLGVRTAEEAITLMLVAQSENRHPMTVAKEYHVIKGRPSLKADAMLARFQQAGGKVEWEELSDKRVCATFTHPQAGSVKIDWDMDRANKAGLPKNNENWNKYPRAMLRSRVISEGIRTAFPSVLIGFYTTEEVEDIIAEDEAKKRPVGAVDEVRREPQATKRKSQKEVLKDAAEKAAKPKPEAVEVEAVEVKAEPLPEPKHESASEIAERMAAKAEAQNPPTEEEVKAEAQEAYAEATTAAEQVPPPKSPEDDMAEWIDSARDAAENGVDVTKLKEKAWSHFGRPLPKEVLNALMDIYKKQQEAENGRA